jgi:hypothetical protein
MTPTDWIFASACVCFTGYLIADHFRQKKKDKAPKPNHPEIPEGCMIIQLAITPMLAREMAQIAARIHAKDGPEVIARSLALMSFISEAIEDGDYVYVGRDGERSERITRL